MELSEQELLECSWEFGSSGCAKGFTHRAFDYIIQNGIHSEESYPYLGSVSNDRFLNHLLATFADKVSYVQDEYQCIQNTNQKIAKMSSYVFLPPQDENAFKFRLAFGGPISCIMCVSDSFRWFGGGNYWKI